MKELELRREKEEEREAGETNVRETKVAGSA